MVAVAIFYFLRSNYSTRRRIWQNTEFNTVTNFYLNYRLFLSSAIFESFFLFFLFCLFTSFTFVLKFLTWFLFFFYFTPSFKLFYFIITTAFHIDLRKCQSHWMQSVGWLDVAEAISTQYAPLQGRILRSRNRGRDKEKELSPLSKSSRIKTKNDHTLLETPCSFLFFQNSLTLLLTNDFNNEKN